MLQGLFIIGEGTCIIFGRTSINLKGDSIIGLGVIINRNGRIIIVSGRMISIEGTVIIALGRIIIGQSRELFLAPKQASERIVLSLAV